MIAHKNSKETITSFPAYYDNGLLVLTVDNEVIVFYANDDGKLVYEYHTKDFDINV